MAFQTLAFRDGALVLLDQRKLPARTEYLEIRTARGVAEAIRAMVVRGAPAIGCAAAFGLALAARDAAARSSSDREADQIWEAAREDLRGSRPTAVNLGWALARLSAARERLRSGGASAPGIARSLLAEAEAVAEEDLAACKAIGAHGTSLVPAGLGILTHCNAGALATAGYGTALGVIRSAAAARLGCPVFACETRPWLQGARLTAWELLQDQIPVTLLPDGAAAALLASGRVGCVVVGADRIARNGDVANKIGTRALALAARDAEVPFFVAAPLSTLDLAAHSGEAIPIEERPAHEVTHLAGARVAAEGAGVWNPAFDVTPHRLVTAVVTERGIVRPPFAEALEALAGAGPGPFS